MTLTHLRESIAMNTIRILTSSFFVASLALTGIAQAQSVAATPPGASASMPHDCAKPMAKHSHPAEKGNPMTTSKSDPCALAAPATTKKDKTKHDHAKDAK